MGAESVSGSVRLKFGDLIRSSWTPRLKYTILFTALIFLAGNFPQIRAISFDQESIIPDLIVIMIFFAAFVVSWVLIMAAIAAICYRRMRDGHLDVTYEIRPDMLLISDTTGIRINIPWALVKSATEDKHAFRLNLRPAGQRYYPKRAFAQSDLLALRAMITQHLGAKAKLRG